MKPWFTGPLVVTRAALDEVERHALACYPDEACGLMAGPADDARRVTAAIPFENLANRYHRLDPEAYPRDARRAYRMNDKKRLDAVERGEREGAPVKVLYHSHCDVGSYFSDEDKQQAIREGTLLGDVAWLVTSVRAGGVVDDHKVFVYDEASRSFEALALTVE